MAVRRLSVMLQILGQGAGAEQAARNSNTANPATLAKDAPGILQSAVVESVVGTAEYQLVVNGARQTATAATDEPLRAGAQAWVSQTATGAYVLLGSAKG